MAGQCLVSRSDRVGAICEVSCEERWMLSLANVIV